MIYFAEHWCGNTNVRRHGRRVFLASSYFVSMGRVASLDDIGGALGGAAHDLRGACEEAERRRHRTALARGQRLEAVDHARRHVRPAVGRAHRQLRQGRLVRVLVLVTAAVVPAVAAEGAGKAIVSAAVQGVPPTVVCKLLLVIEGGGGGDHHRQQQKHRRRGSPFRCANPCHYSCAVVNWR
jgi:hypothetical protein